MRMREIVAYKSIYFSLFFVLCAFSLKVAPLDRSRPLTAQMACPGGQGRLSLSTNGDKCAMVNLGRNEKSTLGGMKKCNTKSVKFVHKFNN